MNLVHLWNQYIFDDLWVPVWPNIVASVLWVVPGFIWHKTRLQSKLDAQTEEMKQHHETVVKEVVEKALQEVAHNA